MDDAIITAANRLGRRVPNLQVRGHDEAEILAMAPAMVCDRVHWDGEDLADARELLADLPYPAYSRRWSDGQHRIWVAEGRGEAARIDIADWCAARSVSHSNMRVEASVPFRDVDSIPGGLFGDLVMEAVDWLYPRSFAIRRKLVADLDIIDEDDVRSMMYLFVSDHADRYDADRLGRNGTLNFLAFMFGKLRKWPQDAARTAYGRNAVDDQLRYRRLDDEVLAEKHRRATDAELAQATNATVDEVRRRRGSITTVQALRNCRSLVARVDESDGDAVGVDQLALACEGDVADSALARATASTLTRAVVDACVQVDAKGRVRTDPLALACTYLSFWGERSRQEVAADLGVLPKTVAAAVTRALGVAARTPDVVGLRA